ncbi:sensor domain-containing phosphodiesterase, partial [Vibrio cholerae]
MFTVSRLIPDLASANQVLETMDLPHGQSILVQIFSPLSREHVVQLARLIRSRHPQACLLGCSTEEVIFQGEVHHQVTLLQITVFEQTYLSRAVVDYSDDEAADAERLARQLELTSMSRAVVLFFLGRWIPCKSHDLPYATRRVRRVPVAGGAAN